MFQSPWNFQWETLLQWRMKWPKRENESRSPLMQKLGSTQSQGMWKNQLQVLHWHSLESCAPKKFHSAPPEQWIPGSWSTNIAQILRTCCGGTAVFWARFKPVLSWAASLPHHPSVGSSFHGLIPLWQLRGGFWPALWWSGGSKVFGFALGLGFPVTSSPLPD